MLMMDGFDRIYVLMIVSDVLFVAISYAIIVILILSTD